MHIQRQVGDELDLNIIVTCTKRKRLPVPARLMLRNVREASVEERFCDWRRRLIEDSEQLAPAGELYAGDHWAVARSLSEVAISIGYRPSVWVCSAGYGLVAIEANLAPYSATFATGDPDSVARPSGDARPGPVIQTWWQLLSSWEGPSPSSPRSLADLADSCPTTPMIVAAPASYMGAVATDAKLAAARLASSDHLTIVSAGSDNIEGLNDCLAPCDARLQPLVGGSLASLNVRIVRKMLLESKRWPIMNSVLIPRYAGLLANSPRRSANQRQRLTDEQVGDFICRERQVNPASTKSSLLRKLRDGGQACEQSRFAAVYDRAKAGLGDHVE